MAKIDLHVHSNHSADAEFPPAVLVEMAAAAKLETLAIADHNVATAVGEAIAAGKRCGVEIVSAIEIDCRFEEFFPHLLGYFINPEHPGYALLWEDLAHQEKEASVERVRLAGKLGFRLDSDRVMAMSRDGMVTGELIARVAMDEPANRDNPVLAPYYPGGVRSDNPYVNFYWDYCSNGKPAYVEVRFPALVDAVHLIRDSGGVPVIAHPGQVFGESFAILRSLSKADVAGVEAYSSYHSAETCRRWLEAGEALDMIVTCGSDFHGANKPSIRLGAHGGDAIEEEGLARLRHAAKNR